MIVMKFGGSSVASPAAIKRVASIVQSQLHREPAVVVSALGNTTDQLSGILKHAAAAESYLAWKLIKELREYHFSVAEDLLGSHELEAVDRCLRETFRDLHVRMSEVCDGERAITPAETDFTLSLGEQLSSLIVSAAFRQLGIPCRHLDSRKLILTDGNFNNATPRYWETYAKIRWAIPPTAQHSAVVLGGFIAATEQGQPTTLGRGGSDLTATLVGAAVNAEEIQIWKDVDGILTADPRIKSDALLVKNLSYLEAAELAKAGAKILHPETIAPAQRLRIPIILRNTFNPGAEGSSITFAATRAPGKSIVCKSGITLLEVSSGRAGVSIEECCQALDDLFVTQKGKLESLGMSSSVLYLALDRAAKLPEFCTPAAACIQAHLRADQALITVIGEDVAAEKIRSLLPGLQALVLPHEPGAAALRIAVPESHLTACLKALHHALFAAPDANLFAKPSRMAVPRRENLGKIKPNERALRIQQALALAGGRLPLRG